MRSPVDFSYSSEFLISIKSYTSSDIPNIACRFERKPSIEACGQSIFRNFTTTVCRAVVRVVYNRCGVWLQGNAPHSATRNN
jgi:hypothetical protein